MFGFPTSRVILQDTVVVDNNIGNELINIRLSSRLDVTAFISYLFF